MPLEDRLKDKTAVVTGAARGIGRGIAMVLAEAGVTVYVTDCETRGRKRSSLPGTVEDTAEQITARGGRAIPVAVDHSDDRAVAALFDRVAAEVGGLDLLVANAFGGSDADAFTTGPFWTLPLDFWAGMFDNGVRGHLVAAHFAAPLLIARRGLVVLTGYAHRDPDTIALHVYYDLAMNAVSRLAFGLAHDLRPHSVTALAISPGLTRTEAITAQLGPMPPGSDSIEFPGRAVRALLGDPDVARHAGHTISVADLAEEYGFSDPEAAPAGGDR
jgi:dehydrogenase/reductase SDR family protein 1